MRLVFLIIATLASCLALPPKHSNLKIYGGESAEPGQFPFVVAINVTELGRQVCVGSIIHENWILTTAICSDFRGPMIVSGTNQLDSDSGVVYNVSRIVVHPNYTEENFPEANIALFQIDGSFNFSELVQPIELGEVSVNDSVVVAGWGYTETGLNPALQYASELIVWSNEDCKTATGLNNFGSGDLCAFRKGAGLCVGDLAAPLVLDGTLVGLGSWGFWCGEYPDVYTRVSYYKDWIDNVIKG